MTYHARPLPTTTEVGTGLHYSLADSDISPESQPAPVVTAFEPATTTGSARQMMVPAEVSAPSLPWYRSEPWLAVELAAFLPMTVAIVVPPAFRIPLVGLSALLAVLGLALLIRQRSSRKHSDSWADPGPTAPAQRVNP